MKNYKFKLSDAYCLYNGIDTRHNFLIVDVLTVYLKYVIITSICESVANYKKKYDL